MSRIKDLPSMHSRLALVTLAGMTLLVAGGCRVSHQSVASDETFFIPLTTSPGIAEVKAQTTAPTSVRPRPGGNADSLLSIQREQERRIGVLAVQVGRLEASRRGTRTDTVKAAPRTSPHSVTPAPAAVAAAGQTLEVAERLYGSREYRKALGLCQELIQQGLAKGKEGRCYFLMGASHYRLKQFDLASVSLKKSLEFKGSSKRADASFLLGMTYKQLGMLDRAAVMYQAALKESPDAALARSLRRELDRLAKRR